VHYFLVVLLATAGYFIGTFPSAIMVAKANGIDITTVGSGNPGASNVARALGMKKGAYVYGLDAVKGAVATGLGLAIFGNAAAFWCAAAAVIGHVYPITRRFAGGKGVATASGAMLVVHPFISLGLLFLWAVLSKTTKKASVSSLIITFLLPICIAAAGAPGWEVGATIGIGILVVIRHIPNLRRLRSGLEPSLPSKAT
jgi:acyl phosphate:glycerol-3-phosphate acyltransferase